MEKFIIKLVAELLLVVYFLPKLNWTRESGEIDQQNANLEMRELYLDPCIPPDLYVVETCNEMQEIIPRLWLGHHQLLPCQIARANITHVVSVSTEVLSALRDGSSIAKFLGLHFWHDHLLADNGDTTMFINRSRTILEHIDSILSQNNDTRVLVHCHAGISRSPSIIAAYLITRHNMSDVDAVEFITNKRPCVESSFLPALQQIYQNNKN